MGWPFFKAKLPGVEKLETEIQQLEAQQLEAIQYQQLKEALTKGRGLEYYQERQLEQARQLQNNYQAQILGYGSIQNYGLGGYGLGVTYEPVLPHFDTIEDWIAGE